MNFRRFLSFFTIVILVVTLFSACKGKKGPTLEEKPGDIEETKVVFSETIEKTDKTGLYELGTEITNNAENIKIVAGNETAHLCVLKDTSLEVTHFSVFENKKLATTTLNGTSWNYGVLEKDGFYAVELSSATLFVYDRDGTKKSETKLDEGALSFAFLQKAGENIIYKKSDSNILYKFNLTSKEKTQTKESFEVSGKPSYDEANVYVKAATGKSYSISFKDLKVTKTRTESFREYYGPVGIATEKNYFTIALLNTGKEKIMIEKKNAEEKILCASDSRLVTKAGTYFRCYDFTGGMVTEEIGKEKENVIDAQLVGDDYIFAAVRKTDSSQNIYRLLKISEDDKKGAATNNRLYDTVIYSDTLNLDGKNTKETDKIAENFGVRFLYDKMGSDFKTDFSYAPVTEKEALEKLPEAEKLLNVITKELLMEATNDREIWVYLCKGLNTKGTEYTNQAGLTKLYNHNVIFIDISSGEIAGGETFSELLSHELAHILDDSMESSVLEPFSELTPAKFKKSGNDQYTQGSEDKEIWFYNKNCKISDKEDRTIILGEMFNAIATSTPTEKFIAENVKKKADFMAKALEESFDFCKANSGGPWNIYRIY